MRFANVALGGLLALSGACSSDGDVDSNTQSLSCEDTGQSYLYLINLIDVGLQAGVTPGFNLDGQVSEMGGSEGCGQGDYTSLPPESEPGVDNQVAELLGLIETQVDVRQELAAAIASGSLAVVVEVTKVDDLQSDDCVEIELGLGYLPEGLTPQLDANGRPTGGEMYDVRPLQKVEGEIVGGRLTSEVLDVNSAVKMGDTSFPLTIQSAQLRFDITADAMVRGAIGGAIPVEQVKTIVREAAPDFADLADILLDNSADLDSDAGECTALSGGFELAGVRATRGATRN